MCRRARHWAFALPLPALFAGDRSLLWSFRVDSPSSQLASSRPTRAVGSRRSWRRQQRHKGWLVQPKAGCPACHSTFRRQALDLYVRSHHPQRTRCGPRPDDVPERVLHAVHPVARELEEYCHPEQSRWHQHPRPRVVPDERENQNRPAPDVVVWVQAPSVMIIHGSCEGHGCQSPRRPLCSEGGCNCHQVGQHGGDVEALIKPARLIDVEEAGHDRQQRACHGNDDRAQRGEGHAYKAARRTLRWSRRRVCGSWSLGAWVRRVVRGFLRWIVRGVHRNPLGGFPAGAKDRVCDGGEDYHCDKNGENQSLISRWAIRVWWGWLPIPQRLQTLALAAGLGQSLASRPAPPASLPRCLPPAGPVAADWDAPARGLRSPWGAARGHRAGRSERGPEGPVGFREAFCWLGS